MTDLTRRITCVFSKCVLGRFYRSPEGGVNLLLPTTGDLVSDGYGDGNGEDDE
jgi:hypothetical protein